MLPGVRVAIVEHELETALPERARDEQLESRADGADVRLGQLPERIDRASGVQAIESVREAGRRHRSGGGGRRPALSAPVRHGSRC